MQRGSVVGGGDMAQLQSTMQAIELACSSIQMHMNLPAAEATIMSLRQSPQPYEACQFILENSQMASARFEAAAAIRDAAVREWGFLSADFRISLISYCLRYVMERASLGEGYVQVKVLSVAAQLMKRGWLEFTASEKEAFFYQVNQSILGVHGVDMQFMGINFLESLVSEFSPSTSSAMGLPSEFHEQCRMSLERDYLKTFYCWAKDGALKATERINVSHVVVPEAKVCTAALQLMLQILNWDFRYRDASSTVAVSALFPGARADNSSTKRSFEYTMVQLDSTWRDILISSGHVIWLLTFYTALREKFSHGGYWLDCPLAVSARKLIIQFCCLSGNVFENKEMQGHHLKQLISGIILWIDPPDVIIQAIESGRSESEMLDGCRALLAIATVTEPIMLDQLLRNLRAYGTLSLLSTLMCDVLKVLAANLTDEETWSWEARDILLDTWTTILMPPHGNQNSLLPAEGIDGAANLFALIVESELRTAAASGMSDDTDSDYLQASIRAMDERLSAYALIARAAAHVTVPLLSRLFSERLTLLHQGKGVVDPIPVLEEIYSLLLITGHVLADEGEGETPLVLGTMLFEGALQPSLFQMTNLQLVQISYKEGIAVGCATAILLSNQHVPDSIRNNFAGCVEADKHPVVLLSCSIIQFAEQSLNPDLRAFIFSPRLMEAVVWFLARWSHTYLLSDERRVYNLDSESNHDHIHSQLGSNMNLTSFFGEHGQGKVVLDLIIRISMTTLLSYPGETDLQSLTCSQLLHALVRRKSICIHLVTLDSWHELANAFANETPLFLLNGANQRSLAETLVLSAYGMRNLEASNQYVRQLMGRMVKHLMELSERKDLRSVVQQPDVILTVSCLLERLRGAAGASEPRTQRALYEMGSSLTTPVLALLEAYKHESAVIYLLLKFVVDWVDGQISYLEPQETASVIDFCMRLLQLYSSHNIGKMSLALSSNLLSESETEKYKDLRALLQLLSRIGSKDLIDFASESYETQETKISEVVYFGLHIVTPLITLELLKYPKLCHDYFSLLSHMVEVYPETVARLQNESFVHVLSTLEFGLRHQDTEVINMCLRALNALASYHYKETTGGKPGLGSHVTVTKAPDGILSRFLRALLQLLLFEDYSCDLVGPAADALFPLILCEQAQYQKLANELIERQLDQRLRARLANAFQALTNSNQLSTNLDRMNYKRFRKNLNSFLIEVRGFLRTI